LYMGRCRYRWAPAWELHRLFPTPHPQRRSRLPIRRCMPGSRRDETSSCRRCHRRL